MTQHDDSSALRRFLARAVKHRCPAWLDAHVDDIVQCAVLKVLKARSRHDPPTLGLAYLSRVAHSAVVDQMRRHARRDALLVSDDALDSVPVPDPTAPPPAVVGNELSAAVANCLEEMNASRRSAVALYLQGRRATEIADELGCNRKRADNLAHRGIRQLRARLTEMGFGTCAA